MRGMHENILLENTGKFCFCCEFTLKILLLLTDVKRADWKGIAKL